MKFNFKILIPSFNELKSLKKIIYQFNSMKEIDIRRDILILDDCSTDKTKIFLKKNKISFLRNNQIIGYENNIIKGINYLKKKREKIDFLITFDADGEHKTKDMKKILTLLNPAVDLIVCNRKKMNRYLEYLISLCFKKKYGIKDPLSGFKVYKYSKIAEEVKKISSNFYLSEVVMIFKEKKYNILNYEINVNIIKNRVSRAGGFFLANKKLLKFLFYIFR